MVKRIIASLLLLGFSFVPALYILFKNGLNDGYWFFLSMYFIYYNYVFNGLGLLILIYYLFVHKTNLNFTFYITFTLIFLLMAFIIVVITAGFKDADAGVFLAITINGILSALLIIILKKYLKKKII
jgi:hypothetical protein